MSFINTNNEPFSIGNGKANLVAANPAPAAVLIDATNSPAGVVVVTNRGDVDVSVAFGGPGVTTTFAAGYIILARSKETLRLPAGTASHFVAITELAGQTAPIQLTTGFGQ